MPQHSVNSLSESHSCKTCSLGQVENAREYLHCLDQKPDQATLEKLQAVEEHIGKCAVARRSEDWTTMLKKAVAATTSGADASPQVKHL